MTTSSQKLYYAGEIALWLQRSCGDELEFLGCHNVTGVSVPRGDLTPSYCRTDKRKWEVQRSYRGVPGLGSMTILTYDTVVNLLQELPCPFNLYAFYSACGSDEDPTNWDFVYIYYSAEPTSEDIDTLAIGMTPGDETEVRLSMPASFHNRLKVKRLEVASRDVSGITTNDINDIFFCDQPECSDLCGSESIGCQVGYFVTDSEGIAAIIGKTTDGGTTWSAIATPFTVATDDIVAGDCDGDTVIVVNGTTSEYAYSWDAGTTWPVVTTPIQVMNDVFMLGATKAWFCGHNGYIYYSNDRGATVTLQDAGVATAQSLNMIAFADANRGYAVGDSNAFVYTRDGGDTWVAGTGPAAAVFPNDLYAVAVVPNSDILVVTDESGNKYRSEDYGQNWTTIFTANINTAGGIPGVAMCDCNVIAFVSNNQDPYFYASPTGYMYQSIDGGVTWTGIELPPNNGLRAITCCDVNKYWLVGDAGFVAKAAGPGI